MSLALDQDSPDQDGNQFATFENDLRKIRYKKHCEGLTDRHKSCVEPKKPRVVL